MKYFLNSFIIVLLLIFVYFAFATKIFPYGFKCTNNEENRESVLNNSSDVLNLLFLGDSYTVGQGIENEDSWPAKLIKKLLDEGISIDESRVLAGNGWSSGDLLRQLAYIDIDNNFDLAFLLIGVNDQFSGRDQQIYQKDFEKLLKKSIKAVGNDQEKVFVLSVPDYSVTPAGSAFNPDKTKREIDEFNEINGKISGSYGVNYFNITEISRSAVENRDLVAVDGLHYSGEMYKKWVDLILSKVLKEIKKK